MGRPSEFSGAGDDCIILGTKGRPTEVVNALLLAKGFPAHTAKQITHRRRYINRDIDSPYPLARAQAYKRQLRAEIWVRQQELEESERKIQRLLDDEVAARNSTSV